MGDIFDEPRELVRNEILELKESGYDIEEKGLGFSEWHKKIRNDWR